MEIHIPAEKEWQVEVEWMYGGVTIMAIVS